MQDSHGLPRDPVAFVELYTQLLNTYPLLREAQTNFDINQMRDVLRVISGLGVNLYMQLHE